MSSNPLLQNRPHIPWENIRLPSRALYYTTGELTDEATPEAEIRIRPMTTSDEIILKTPNMLFQGSAIEEVFKRCSPDILKPQELLSMDVNYILTYLRKISYGEFLTIRHKCTTCPDRIEVVKDENGNDVEITVKPEFHSYDIPINHFLTTVKEIDANKFAEFNLELGSGETILFSPPRYRDIIKYFQKLSAIEDSNKVENDSNEIIRLQLEPIIYMIDNVNGHKDKNDILEWLMELPPLDKDKIFTAVESIHNVGMSFKYTINCKDHGCEKKEEIEVPIDPSTFFTASSPVKTTKT